MLYSEGVVVGCDINQEWLLPWWWERFSKHNPNYTVAFADFGMSESCKKWCSQRGILISISTAPVAPKEVLDDQMICTIEKSWQERGETTNFWQLREQWFKKPLAMIHSPFEKGLWLDLDCEVRGNLELIFSTPLSSAGLSLLDSGTSLCLGDSSTKVEFPQYNSGVVLFKKDSLLLELWGKGIQEGSRLVRTDDELLSFIIAHFQIKDVEMSSHFNWEVLKHGPNPSALIYHWMGEKGKEAIRLMS